MREWKSQSHVKWYCKYHIVFSPKYRKKAMFGSLRKGVGKILRELCNQSGVELVEGHAMSDHVHLCLSIPPKYSVANTVGFLKGKSARRCCTARSKSLTSLCRLQSHPAQYVSGIPSAAILLSISHPIRCSTRCLANVRARISGPMIAL